MKIIKKQIRSLQCTKHMRNKHFGNLCDKVPEIVQRKEKINSKC